jgi:hypothetical protein
MSLRKNFLVFGSSLIEEVKIAEVVVSLRSSWISSIPKLQHHGYPKDRIFPAKSPQISHGK